MKSIKPEVKSLRYKVHNIILFIFKNCKLETSIIILTVLYTILQKYIPNIEQAINLYFDVDRCSGIAGVASIIIGIYVTIWSIFATSVSKINVEILKKKIEGQLFLLIGIGLFESFILTLLCVFIPSSMSNYIELLALFTILTIVSFVKFVILIMMITKLNIKYIVMEVDEQNKKHVELYSKIDEIYRKLIK